MNATLLCLAFYLVSIFGSAVDPQDLICASDNDCYPRIFRPSHEWQVIREGQDIPGGLHVRMDVNTGEKQAKFMAPEEEHGVVLVEDQPEKPASSAPKVSESELASYGNAVNEIIAYDNDDSNDHRLGLALDALGELSHDLEFGVKITADSGLFEALDSLTKKHASTDIVDQIYRITLSALRNNAEAVQGFLAVQPASYIGFLFDELHSKVTPDVIKKRILGIIHALTANDSFRTRYFDGDQSLGYRQLTGALPFLSADAKVRVFNLFEDLKLVHQFEPSTQIKIPAAPRKFEDPVEVAKILQRQFVENSIDSESEFKHKFDKLTTLHQNNDIPVSDGFIEWLDSEAAQRKDGSRKRDNLYSGSDPDFDKAMLEARNLVFGNPNGMRRHMEYDEL